MARRGQLRCPDEEQDEQTAAAEKPHPHVGAPASAGRDCGAGGDGGRGHPQAPERKRQGDGDVARQRHRELDQATDVVNALTGQEAEQARGVRDLVPGHVEDPSSQTGDRCARMDDVVEDKGRDAHDEPSGDRYEPPTARLPALAPKGPEHACEER